MCSHARMHVCERVPANVFVCLYACACVRARVCVCLSICVVCVGGVSGWMGGGCTVLSQFPGGFSRRKLAVTVSRHPTYQVSRRVVDVLNDNESSRSWNLLHSHICSTRDFGFLFYPTDLALNPPIDFESIIHPTLNTPPFG